MARVLRHRADGELTATNRPNSTEWPLAQGGLVFLALRVETDFLCGQLGYHLLESLDERVIGDRRFQPRTAGKLLVDLEALLTHGSPQKIRREHAGLSVTDDRRGPRGDRTQLAGFGDVPKQTGHCEI
jgi:hypothetical protein